MKKANKTKLYEIYDSLFYPPAFAPWARPKSSRLNEARTRYLDAHDASVWEIQKDANGAADHLEMSGFYVSAILSYGKDANGHLRVMKHLIVPALRLQPNATRSSYSHNFKQDAAVIKHRGKKLMECPQTVSIKGSLKITSTCGCGVEITREFLPAVRQGALIEAVEICNTAESTQTFSIEARAYLKQTRAFWCIGGAIAARTGVVFDDPVRASAGRPREVRLTPEERYRFYCVYDAYQGTAPEFSVKKEILLRQNFIAEMFNSLKLKTPVQALNAQFSHCVLRGSESIFQTKNGLMHSPGGGNYYAALWTNDQCEYANPFFPFLGYGPGIEQSLNCYRLYRKYMDCSNTPFRDKRAIVTSIIACGDGFWNGAGDRGDSSMYAYGLSRFLLCLGDLERMREFFGDLEWCLSFALSRKNEHGVIESDSDELENRFESGNANLFTSCLTYDALGNGALIAEILGHREQAARWREEQRALHTAIEQYFGDEVEGFSTYRYYDGNRDLRAWICMPLTVEIFDRAGETVRALFSDRLYRDGMMRTTSADETTWDRSLLFALRGTLLAGEAEAGVSALCDYCRNRLLGSHAPYAFEAYPEGNRAHLAAENLLFARAVTEGLFGLRTVGYRQLRIRPQLCKQLPQMELQGLRLFGETFDVACTQQGISVTLAGTLYQTERKEAVFDFETRSFLQDVTGACAGSSGSFVL